jgi:hypothetical protein
VLFQPGDGVGLLGRACAAVAMSRCLGPGAPLSCLEDWYATPLGREVVAVEGAAVERQLDGVIGYYLLQIGVAGVFGGSVGEGRIRRRIHLPAAPRPSVPGLQAAAEPAWLPIASDSVDAVLLPHTWTWWTTPRRRCARSSGS